MRAEQDTPLVGRSDERAELTAALSVTGPAVVVVEGEAGIGKTTLLDAVLARVGRPVHHAVAEEMQAHRPFGLLLDAVGVVPPGPHPAEPTAAEPAGRFGVAEALLSRLDEVTAPGPAVLALEDLHWADPASLGVLHQLARADPAPPLTVVVTLRPVPRRAELDALLGVWRTGGARWLPLGPLSAEACAELAEELLGAPAAPELLAEVARAAGNPLFIGELVTALRQEGALTPDPHGRLRPIGTAGSASLSLAILGRLRYLPRRTLEMLGPAAVLGASFRLQELARLTGGTVAEGWMALRDALAAGVLREDGDRLTFQHELLRDAVYRDLPRAVRVGLHADAARVLAAAGAAPVEVAEHVLRSVPGPDAEAIEWLRRAAADVVDRAPAVAVEFLDAALARCDPATGATAADLRADRALALVAAGDQAAGEAACRQALAEQPGPAGAELRAALVRALLAQGRLAEVLAESRSALAEESVTGAERARLLGISSVPLLFARDFAAAEATARAAEDLAADTGDTPARLIALRTRIQVAGFRGRAADAMELGAEVLALTRAGGGRELHEHGAQFVHAGLLTAADRMAEAAEVIESELQATQRWGIASGMIVAHLFAGQRLFLLGEWADAEATLAAGLGLAAETGTGWQTDGWCLRALIACRRGDLGTARHRLARADTVPDGRFHVGWTRWARAAVEHAAGDRAAALETLTAGWRECVDAGMAVEYRLLGPDLAAWSVAAGDRGPAADVADALAEQAAAPGAPPGLAGAARWVRALADADPDGLVAALTEVRCGPRPYEWARCAEDAAVALAAAGRLPEARALGRDALAGFAELRADGELARASAALRRAGLRLGVRGGRRRPASGWAALTATEARVARLVAEPMSNPEVAAALFLSRRTVACHVSHLLAKLGMSSRTELVAAARRGSLEQLGEGAE